jgi:hypothetical protein
MRVEERNLEGSGFKGWFLVDGERVIRLQVTSVMQIGGRHGLVHLNTYYRNLQGKELGRYEDINGKSFDIDQEERGGVMSKNLIKFFIDTEDNM